MRARHGLTLVELLVALALAGTLLAAVVRVHAAQERAHRTLVRALAVDARVRDAAAILPVTLRALSPAEGDVPSRAALDTALELRETIATGVACAAADDWVALPADDDAVSTLAASLARPEAGDSAWLLAATDSVPRWYAFAVADVGGGSGAGGCGALRLQLAPPPLAAGFGVGTVVRVTRRSRWSLYRAADGLAWLGFRTTSAGRLTTVQPVSGPYAFAPAFRYFDAAGSELAAGSDSASRIARIDVQLRAIDARDPRGRATGPRPAADRDPTVARMTIAPRNP